MEVWRKVVSGKILNWINVNLEFCMVSRVNGSNYWNLHRGSLFLVPTISDIRAYK